MPLLLSCLSRMLLLNPRKILRDQLNRSASRRSTDYVAHEIVFWASRLVDDKAAFSLNYLGAVSEEGSVPHRVCCDPQSCCVIHGRVHPGFWASHLIQCFAPAIRFLLQLLDDAGTTLHTSTSPGVCLTHQAGPFLHNAQEPSDDIDLFGVIFQSFPIAVSYLYPP